MASKMETLDPATLKTFENAAAGHEGVLSDPSGELLIKPCTKAEINFYQQTLADHPDFAELMPTFMGTLQLGAPAQIEDSTAAHEQLLESAQAQKDPKLHGAKLATETAIVLENLEYGFKCPNVLDIKLGSVLYDSETTEREKAARLDKVASETTSGALNFRIAGMKVWSGGSFEMYDKFYGRNLTAKTVGDGFATFFKGLTASLRPDDAAEILETIEAEIAKARFLLEGAESRMFSTSLLIVYEGDSAALDNIMGGVPKTPRLQEKAPTLGEVKQSEEDEEEEEDDPPVAFKVKMIDFAHAAWTPGQGTDDNVVTGLKNVEKQMDEMISKLVE